jgi:hypothetical protein
MTALSNIYKHAGHRKQLRSAEYYKRCGILDLLIQYARDALPQTEQCRRLNALNLRTVKNSTWKQPQLSVVISRMQALGFLPQSVVPQSEAPAPEWSEDVL